MRLPVSLVWANPSNRPQHLMPIAQMSSGNFLGVLSAIGVFFGLLGLIIWNWRLRAGLQQERAGLETERALLSEKERLVLDKATHKAEALALAARKERDDEKRQYDQAYAKQQAQLATQEAELAVQKDQLARLRSELQTKAQQLADRDAASQAKETALDEKLVSLAQCSKDEAKKLVIAKVETELEDWIGQKIKDGHEKIKKTVEETAKHLIIQTVQRTAVQVVGASATTTIILPNDELKGRIIGKEGRNIRAFELQTGCDIIIDDSPDEVTLSCFDPIRREIGRLALTALVADGRINPARIEAAVKNSQDALDKTIEQLGREAVDELKLDLHPKLITLVGRLNFRTSYGQNILKHAVEAAHIAGNLATELGGDVDLAKRGALLHDIGKALDFESTGTHVDLGESVCRKYGESDAVINCINAHHEDEEPATLEARLVMIADAVSSARPGSRRESLEQYIERLTQLESIAKTFNGVKKVYAIQAGREIRVLVQPEKVTDSRMYKLARSISKRIESEVSYPGEVVVSLIRETRAYSTAK